MDRSNVYDATPIFLTHAGQNPSGGVKCAGKIDGNHIVPLKPSDIQNMVETVEKAWGKVDILVNNAGIQHVSSIEDFPTDKWDDVIAINLS
ncbi:MAG: SDR family NAD(P)-dependent oxidoreductase, partial [Betaproteobacteria bacterium]|nr:SDR family NAD(P)-dependent oxidoreductase [Betaproteobacteria bacterium]